MADRDYADYTLSYDDAEKEGPDVLLDVPVVNVDEIDLEVALLKVRLDNVARIVIGF